MFYECDLLSHWESRALRPGEGHAAGQNLSPPRPATAPAPSAALESIQLASNNQLKRCTTVARGGSNERCSSQAGWQRLFSRGVELDLREREPTKKSTRQIIPREWLL